MNVSQAQGSDSRPDSSTQDAMAAVVVRNQFYLDGRKVLSHLVIGQIIGIAVLVFLLLGVLTNTGLHNHFFPISEDGKLIRQEPLYKPFVSDAVILSWVSGAAVEIMTFGHHDFRMRLLTSQRHFTRNGWEQYTQALNDATIIDLVRNDKYILSAELIAAPSIIQEGVNPHGRYEWTVEFPIRWSFMGTRGRVLNTQTVRLVVVRVSNLETPLGIGIEQWVSKTTPN